MKRNKSDIPVLILIAFCSISFGQSPQQNLDKYWHYRERLYDYFMVDVDPGSYDYYYLDADAKMGVNLPADVFNPTDLGRVDKRRTVPFPIT